LYSAAWRVFLPLVESSCHIWFPMLTFAFLSLPLLRKTDVKIRKQTEKRETKRKQETVFYVFLRVSSANIGKFKLSLNALILSVFAFICFLVFSNAFWRTKIFLTSCSLLPQHWGMSLTLNIAFLIFMIHNYNISSEARTNVLLNFAKSQQMKAKDNFLLSSFAFSPVKLYHRNSMILHGRKGETETKCLRKFSSKVL
jgi:hypothetical protein